MVAVRRPGGPISATVKINEQALKDAIKRLRGAGAKVHNHRVTVGLHEQEGAQEKLDYHGNATSSRLADVMAVHEFGAGNTPSRSWLRDWFDENRTGFLPEMKKAMQEEYENYTTGIERSPAMVDFGTGVLENLKERLNAGLEPGLAQSTMDARESAGLDAEPALVATEQFWKALSAHVDGFPVKK